MSKSLLLILSLCTPSLLSATIILVTNESDYSATFTIKSRYGGETLAGPAIVNEGSLASLYVKEAGTYWLEVTIDASSTFGFDIDSSKPFRLTNNDVCHYITATSK